MKGHSTGYLATTTTDKQGHKKKKNTERCHKPKETRK